MVVCWLKLVFYNTKYAKSEDLGCRVPGPAAWLQTAGCRALVTLLDATESRKALHTTQNCTQKHQERRRLQKKSVLCLGESRTRLDQTGAEREAHLYVSSELDQLLLRHPHRHVSHLLQGLGLPLSAHQDFHCRTDRSSGRHRSSPSPLLVSSRCPTAPTDSPVPAAEQPQLPLPQPLAPPDADGT